MKLGDYVTLAVLAAIALAVVFARRRGKAAEVRAHASAFASGEASMEARLAAMASATNSVDLGGIHFGGSTEYGKPNPALDELCRAIMERLPALGVVRPGGDDNDSRWRPALHASNYDDDERCADHDYDRADGGIPVRGGDVGFAPGGRSGRVSHFARPRGLPVLGDVGVVVGGCAVDGAADRVGRERAMSDE